MGVGVVPRSSPHFQTMEKHKVVQLTREIRTTKAKSEDIIVANFPEGDSGTFTHTLSMRKILTTHTN